MALYLPLFRHLNFLDYSVDLRPEGRVARDNFVDLGVELFDVDLFAGVLRLDVGGNGEIIIVLSNLFIRRQMRKVLFFGMSGEDGNDLIDVRLRQFVVVRDLDTLVRRVDEKCIAVGFVLFQHHDAGGDGRAEKEIAR